MAEWSGSHRSADQLRAAPAPDATASPSAARLSRAAATWAGSSLSQGMPFSFAASASPLRSYSSPTPPDGSPARRFEH